MWNLGLGCGIWVWGLGFGVWGVEFGAWVWGLGFGVWGLGFGVWGLEVGGGGLRIGSWCLGVPPSLEGGVGGWGWGVGGWRLVLRVTSVLGGGALGGGALGRDLLEGLTLSATLSQPLSPSHSLSATLSQPLSVSHSLRHSLSPSDTLRESADVPLLRQSGAERLVQPATLYARQTLDYESFTKSQLAQTKLTSRPDLAYIWSRYPQNPRQRNLLGCMV